MDYMDVDQILDVPDTPDRIPLQNINASNCIKRGNNSSVTNHSRTKDLSNEGVRSRPTDNSQQLAENGRKRLLFRSSKSPVIADKPDRHSTVYAMSSAPSSKNALPLKGKHFIHPQPTEKGKGLCSSNSQSQSQSFAVPRGALGNTRAEEFRKLSVSANAFSSSASSNVCKVRDTVDEKCKAGSSFDRGKGIDFVVNSQPRAGQKRLVRNGCISPLNIAKVKQSTELPNNSPVHARRDDVGAVASDDQPGMVDIRDLITETNDSHRFRGKGVINHPLSSKGPDGMSSRSSKTSYEKIDGTSNNNGDSYKNVEELGQWRTTRNRTRNINLPSSSVPPFVQPVQHANARIKRQKQGSASNTNGECSTSNFDDSEIVCLGSSVEPSNSRSTRDPNRNGLGVLDPVIEIDEFSPEVRENCSRNIGCSSNDDSDARARQLEADEMLARELQEELYNEVPGVEVAAGQIDADIALVLQQQESPQRTIPSRSRAVRPRGSSMISNLRRQSQTLSSIRRGGTQARVPTSTRMARLRGRFPGQPRTLSSSSGGVNSVFPPNMDLDMRMHILETLEAFSEMGMPGGALQVQRDFNENDYEMLLALDENNHQHGGASLAQINGLPQSTVQSDNHQEACAICLDTPTTGDTIRHLPCLHRFHKDCIDPWLRRKTSCPVCKSSIT
ncbi:hypothetical protein LguiB_026034 [Lonicera macranthoides]